MAGLTMDPIAHLYRRAGFGATPAELAAGRQQGYAATLDQILNFDSVPDADGPDGAGASGAGAV